MASHPKNHPIRPATSSLSHQKRKRTSSPPPSSARNPIPTASKLSRREVEQTFSSSTATCPHDSPPSSFSSVDHPEIKYDVFLSFRGKDTRFGFLSHLLRELSRNEIEYFVDIEKLEQGDEISSTLLNAIKKSEISLVVLSENYADSKWCLEELEQVIQCMENQKQTVIPIFHKVHPSTVRHQIGSYRVAFEKHGERFEQHRLQKWKTALNKTANLSGFDSSEYKAEADFVTGIVQQVLKRLNKTSRQSDLKGLIGIQKHIESLDPLLRRKTKDVIIIGIWGMAGIGKTTIAKVLFNRLHNEFEGKCFLNVRKWLKEHGGELAKENLLSMLLGNDPDNVGHNVILSDYQRRLHRKKVLIVLDDINSLIQREILIDGHELFGPNSRVIVTSRDKDLFNKCDHIYEVPRLGLREALQLFNLNALPEDCFVNEKECNELLMKMVKYCKGHPLAIKVIGCSLYGKDKNEWKNKLKKLDKILDPDIQDVLQLSYDDLDYGQKDIFLFLACFFDALGCNEEECIISLLDDDEYYIIDGLSNLQNKALITIDEWEIVSMHDLIRKMGRDIVRNECPKNPGQRRHLCDADDIYKVLKNNMGTEEIESIKLSWGELKRDLHLTPQSFARMDNLKLLRFDTEGFGVYPPEEDFILPAQLRFISWNGCRLKSIDPLRSCLGNLVVLRMWASHLEKLWDGVQELPRLKDIDLSLSEYLIELPDLSEAPKLESVHLDGCISLRHVPLWPSTSTMRYVLPSLQHLNLSGCEGISELPDNIDQCLPSLHSLDIGGTSLKALPESIMHLTELTYLDVSFCTSLEIMPELPPSIERLVAIQCDSLEEVQFSPDSMPLHIGFPCCEKMRECTLEKVAEHYKCSIEKMISSGREESDALLYFSGSKVPECFKSCCPTNDSVSLPLDLPLNSEAMGFIFYILIDPCEYFCSDLTIKCHIELSNGGGERYICESADMPPGGWISSNDVYLLYKGSLSLKIMEEISTIKASTTTDDGHVKVWFELLDSEFNDRTGVLELGVYRITSSEP